MRIGDERLQRLNREIQTDTECQQRGKRDAANDEMTDIFAKDTQLSLHDFIARSLTATA